MSREIKFKAWYPIERTMLLNYANNQNPFSELMVAEFHRTSNLFFAKKLVLLQFTGIKDVYDKEIYEGDILKTEQGIAYVIWFDAYFALKSPGSEAIDFEHSSVYESSEVIGNIYENPDLLK